MENVLDKTYQAAIYLRLSKEDGDFAVAGDKRESNSISNQRKLIEDFIKKHPEIVSTQEFCDDGYTGTNFDRPDFQKMIELVRQRKINCIVVKDLSRFGREYIEVGRYIEKIFPAIGVRFIAINDSYDSASAQSTGNEIIIPFKNLINDSYSRDISIKVRSNLDIKRRNGEFVGTHVVYGYRRSDENKNQLVIDKEAAAVVQSIFRMKMDGHSPYQIAQKLNMDGVPSPCEYKRKNGSHYKTVFQQQAKSQWSAKAVYRILQNEMYTGTLVQGKTSTPNYKIKRRSQKDSEDWTRVANAHEAIISTAVFDLIQKLMRDDTRSTVSDAAVPIFSGKVFCMDCQSSMVRRKRRAGGKEYSYLVCSGHKHDKHTCSSHMISEKTVYDAVLALVQSQVALALDLESALGAISGISWEKRELEQIERKIAVQEETIRSNKQMKLSLYDDLKQEIVTLEEYRIFKEEFDRNIKEATENISRLNSDRNKVKGGLTGQQSWLSQFRQYKNIQELTRRVVVNFVERIEISEDKQIHVVLSHSDQFRSIKEFLGEFQTGDANSTKEMAKEVG